MEAISIDEINQLKEENAKLRSELILVSNQYNKVVEQNKELPCIFNKP